MEKSILSQYADRFKAGGFTSPETDGAGRTVKVYTDLAEVPPIERGHNSSSVHVTRARVTKVEGQEDETANADLRHFTYHITGKHQGTWTAVYRQGISLALKDLKITATALLELHNEAVSGGFLDEEKVAIPKTLARDES